MICIKCGKKINENLKKCSYCGKIHPDAYKKKAKENKANLIAISTIFLAISIAFLILIFFYSIILLMLGMIVKKTLTKIIILILKLILIFVIPSLLISIILKIAGGYYGKIK